MSNSTLPDEQKDVPGRRHRLEQCQLEDARKPRNIVLCFDGTDGNFGPKPFTNVLKIYRMLDNSDESVQLCYYQPGIGTSMSFERRLDSGNRITPSKLSNLLDSMVAFTLDQHVCSAYLFLMRYYRPKDKIFMFGFSRGAFIARVLAGMIERVGLLNEGLEDIINAAWKIYEAWEYAAQPSQPDYTTTLADEFKKTFSRDYDVEIHFQGLFDSVNSIGIIRDRLFPYAARSKIVQHVRHAVSLDERRGKFQQQSVAPRGGLSKAAYDGLGNPDDTLPKLENPSAPKINFATKKTYPHSAGSLIDVPNLEPVGSEAYPIPESNHVLKRFSEVKLQNWSLSILLRSRRETEGSTLSQKNLQHYARSPATSSDIIEKWFPGDHSDIGGGWVPDYNTKQFLCHIPMRWMLAEAIKNGVIFKKDSIKSFAAKYPAEASFEAYSHDILSFQSRGTAKSSVLSGDKNGNSSRPLLLLQVTLSFVLRIAWAFQVGFCYKRRCAEMLYKSCDFTGNMFAPISVQSHISFNSGRASHAGKGDQSALAVIFWWVMELVPLKRRVQGPDCEWKNAYVPNLGSGRELPQEAELHWSVYWRIRCYKDYRPQNLPKYAVDLLRKYAGIPELETYSLSTRLRKKFMSIMYPPHKNGCVSNVGSPEYELVVAKAEQLLRQWCDTASPQIPDDLDNFQQLY
ncbi:LAQU0S02e02124g1_1 [Lachancea quebecensis]|uniref:LAQU0S02e02124g1_1 n=1 Tax=Lachancea quebecensis TaxID=1654605 RepID=A0A0P1KNE2_9SACH|nr:LAQU0S02e02124g1_1 [Lachancea quebecensis]